MKQIISELKGRGNLFQKIRITNSTKLVARPLSLLQRPRTPIAGSPLCYDPVGGISALLRQAKRTKKDYQRNMGVSFWNEKTGCLIVSNGATQAGGVGAGFMPGAQHIVTTEIVNRPR